jgi:hypothetical protein
MEGAQDFPSYSTVLDSAKNVGFSWVRINGIPVCWDQLTVAEVAEEAKPFIEALSVKGLNIVVTWVPYNQPTYDDMGDFFRCLVEVFDGDGQDYSGRFGSVQELSATVGHPVQYWKIMTESNIVGPVNRNAPYQPVYQLSDYGITDSCLADSVEDIVSPKGYVRWSILWKWFKLYQQALNDLAHYIESNANAIHGAFPEARVIAPSFHMVDLAFWIKAVDAYGNPGKVLFRYYPDGDDWSDELNGTDEHRRKYWHHLLGLNTDGDSLLLGQEIDVIGAHYGSVLEWRRTRTICNEWYDARGIPRRPFWVMEIGGDPCFANNPPQELKQAMYYRDTFVQWLEAVDAGEFDPKKDKVFVFTLWHYDVNNYGGLLHHDNLKPRTAYHTMRNIIRGSANYSAMVDTLLVKPSDVNIR